MASKPVATFSIVACDLDAGQWGVAVQSKFLAVGSVVQWAEPQAGAVATQSYANPRYGPDGLALLIIGDLEVELHAVRHLEQREAHTGGQPKPSLLRILATQVVKGDVNGVPVCGVVHLDVTAVASRADARATATRRRETSSSPRTRSTRSRRRSRRPPAGRSPSGCSTVSTRRRPRAAIVVGSSRPRCSSSRRTRDTRTSPTPSSTCASTTTSGRSTSCAASTTCTTRSSARRRSRSGSTSTKTCRPS